MIHERLAAASTKHLREGAERIETCLGLVDDDFLWADPNRSTVSIGNLVQHLCGNVSQYILGGLGGQPFDRDRQAEFAAKSGASGAVLAATAREVVEKACAVIEELGPGDLERTYAIQGFEMDGVGVLVHVVEHFSYHVGQITFAVKRARDVDTGYYAGLDLDAD